MTRSEALEYFREELKDGKCSDACPTCNAMEWAIKALEEPTTIGTMWHEYPKEPPKEAGEYLVVREGLDESDTYYYTAIWGKSNWLDSCDKSLKALPSYWFKDDSVWGDWIIDDVLAWMPIPKYSKEETDAKIH